MAATALRGARRWCRRLRLRYGAGHVRARREPAGRVLRPRVSEIDGCLKGGRVPDFTVDIDGLKGLQSNLTRCRDNIDEATKRLADLGPDSIGSDELDEACADFRDDWENGLGELDEAVSQIEKGLDASIDAYAQLEKGISESLVKMKEAAASIDIPEVGAGGKA